MTAPAPRYTLLFVDDEPDVTDILRRTFEKRFGVLTASSGPEALDILKSQPVDLLITDQKMPGMTGIELVAAARAAGVDVTAILLTGYTQPEDLIAAINEGQVYRYITKPWDVNDLLITVKNALEREQLRRDKERLFAQLKKRVEALSVLYEVSHQSAADAPTYEAIIDRVMAAVARVLPYDCGGALVELSEGRSATLKIQCRSEIGEKGLLFVKDGTLAAHRKNSGKLLSEDRVITRVSSALSTDEAAPVSFASQLAVPLTVAGRPIGTLALYSRAPNAYSSEDGELLDVLANQTTDAIQSLRAAEDSARRRMERMVECMADGVLLTDEKNEIVVMNPAARKLLRLSDDPAEATAKHLQQVLGFYPFELVRGWEYGGTQVLREELKIFDKMVQSTVSPVTDGKGHLRGVVVVLRDITDQKALEERKEEFVSIVSHELRTPLTSISGALDLVLNFLAGEINEKQQRYLEMARDSTQKLNAMVDDLLDLAKFQKGKLKMSFELCHFDELVKKALERHGPTLMKKGITVHADIPAQGARVLADPNRIGQVLSNLLTNAIKFTPDNGEMRIEVQSPKDAPGFCAFSIWNSGESIADSDLERIFDKFEQARSVRTRTVAGTGLGLSICRNILQSHGGKIWAEPASPGARFVFVLPVEPSPELLASEGDEQPVQPTVQRGTVLVVEDDSQVAYIVKAILLARGYQVLVARSADEALLLARRSRPDLITLDLMLPDVDGFRLANILRHDPETRNAPLLVLSGTDERERAFRQGVAGFLQKPVQADALVSAVESLLRGRSSRPEAKVLVVDDDAKIVAICVEVLSNLGFQVSGAASIEEARKRMREARPDVLLLDVVLPDGDGFSFLEELKAERASSHLSVIFISARTETQSKVRALKLGGDDYLTKPFDAIELGARVESVVRRKSQEVGVSPTTQLPGSGAIEREVQSRLRERKPFAFCYLDLDNLKAYNDYYGYAKADGVIRQTGDLLREIIEQEGGGKAFLGHVAGDDFVFVADPEHVDRICRRAIESFDRIIPLYYDRQDRERGYIEAEDRYGERRKFAIMSVSVVAVMADGTSADHPELARLAADMKKRAKAISGSVYLRSDKDATVRSIA